MAVDKQLKNLNATYIGSGQFSFADGATSPAAAQAMGYRDFGNLKTFSIQGKSTTKPHVGSYNGIKKRDKTVQTEQEIGYQVESDELSTGNLALFMHGNQGASLSQTAKTAVAADALTTPVAGRWYDLLVSGVRVRKLTTVAITSTPAIVEDVDYVIDYETGRIRFITTPPGTLTSISLTAPALTTTTGLKTITPGTTGIKRGIGRLQVADAEGVLQLDHHDFYCELAPQRNPSPGDDYASIKFDINIVVLFGTLATAN